MIAVIPGADLVELVAVHSDAGLGGGLAVASGCGNNGGCSCTEDVEADVVVQPYVAKL